jgi:proteasome assembly chaperone (PAC2) family protein
MNRILIKRFGIPQQPAGTLVVGIPGVGLVGATAARMLLSMENGADPKLLSSFHPFPFLRGVRASKSGMVSLTRCRLHHRPLSGFAGGILVLTARSQPPFYLQHELAWAVLKEAKRLGCNSVLTLGGYQTNSVRADRLVYFCANDLQSYKSSARIGLENFEGPITGAAGVFAGVGKLLDFSGGCMLCETVGTTTPDQAAASALLSALMAFLRPDSPMNRNQRSDADRDSRRGSFLDNLS